VRRSGCGDGLAETDDEAVPRGPAAAVVLDEEQVAAIGEGAKRFPVVATVNGYTWRTSVTRMSGEFLLGLNRAVREAAGVESGDIVEVAIELDHAPRERAAEGLTIIDVRPMQRRERGRVVLALATTRSL